MKKLSIILLGMAVYSWAAVCPAATITVNRDGSGDFATIQAAIADANDLDTIIVAEGTYTENINFGGKDIILTSMDPEDWGVVEATIIDGGGLDSVVRFDGTESSDCKLSGFTITNGYGPADGDGGGITGQGSATITNCIIRDNVAQRHGGGIRGNDGFYGLINRCIIFGNSAFTNGGGLTGCHSQITNCLIYGNKAAGYGGGMVNCNGDIVNCTIVDNTAGVSGGGIASCTGTITNCIIWDNNLEQLSESAVPTYSCVQDLYGGVGNINTEPGFVNAPGEDYHLQFDSACVDAGTNEPIWELGLDEDIDGNVRPLDGDYDVAAIADMGAYELLLPEWPYIVLNQGEFVFLCLEHGPNPAEQILEIRNPGIASFGWEISEDCQWLDVFPTSGETAEEASEVTLQVDTGGLEMGGYVCELTILSQQAVNSPRTVLIGLNIYNEGDIIVPLDYTTIQGAIAAANDLDTIIVAEGTYTENINFGGKDIILTSMDPEDWGVVEATVIDGGGLGSVVRFDGTESSDCKLSGFTITNGYGHADGDGGGITGSGRATITNCIIRDNVAQRHGGGIRGGNAFYGLIDRCIIFGNSAFYNGGGLTGCHGTISNCLIYDNWASGSGGGMVNCNGDIVNCTIADNTALGGSGFSNCDGNISNCIIWGNDIPFPHEGFAGPKLTYCCVEDWRYGGLGNITIDPEFVDAAGGDYHLQFDSACVDAGTNEPILELGLDEDIDGNVRPLDGDCDGLSVADIGAYEALVSEEPAIGILPREVEFVVFEGEANPADKILGIRNSGPGTINWEISYDCDWLGVSPAFGSSACQNSIVTLSVDTTGLVVGEYNCELTITAAGAANSPRVIGVDLRVTDPLLVPAEYGTIQEAINSAFYGDTVLVADGTYTGEGNHNINFEGRAITVRSENGPENCIIDCEDSGSGFYFVSGEDNDSVVNGFTITNASNSAIGCGWDLWYGWGSSPTITNCIITGNASSSYGYGGGGVSCRGGSSPVITNCIIEGNSAFGESSGWSVWGGGGGIFCEQSNMIIINCVIQDNSVSGNEGEVSGGGIYVWDSTVTIINSTIVGNSTSGNGGGVFCYNSDVKIINSIVWDNRALNGPELAIDSGGYWLDDDYSSVLTVSYSDVRGGEDAVYFDRGEPDPFPPGPGTLEWGEGNIDIDPVFVDTGIGDYHLRFESACVDAGTNSPEGGLEIVDLDGNSRVMDGDSDGEAIVDMGAYESLAPDVPYMATIPNEFVFHVFEGGPNPEDQILQIRNIGPDGFDWQIQEDCQWLDISPTSGRIEMETDEVVLQVDKTGLGVGAYNCQLSVLSEQAANSPHTVEVKLYVYVDGAIRVPLEYGTIQGAINSAGDGDTIMVAPGTYYENIKFYGPDIILTSMDPEDWSVVEATVIDGQGLDSVVRFSGSESSDCKLSGFTITNGYGHADGDGGGITGPGRATITNCIIRDNVAQRHGGGIRGRNGFYGLIDRCIIFGNSAFYNGGGLTGCHGTISNCLIYDNWASGYGGGMVNCNGDIINCTIADNTASEGGGLSHSDGNITNCIIWGNHFKQLAYSSHPTYSCIGDFAGGVGNIYIKPGFVNAAGADYHLRFDSACVDAGTNEPIWELGLDEDIDGNARPFDGNHDGTAVADMGAYEVSPPEAPFMALNQSVFVFHSSEGGPNPAEQILEISNPGTGRFKWKIAADCEWLDVWPISGVIAEEADEVTLQVDTDVLEAGGHICELTISSRQAVNSPLTVWIMLNIYNEGAIIVPLDYATIQGAIDYANDGETIIVEPGTYNENIEFGGKNITLRSIKPQDWAVVKQTIIQGDGTRPVVKFAGTENPNCKLLGFTITGGSVPLGGGGIRGKWTEATVANCIIKNNTAGTHGGGIESINGCIDSCIIYANTAGETGGGIAYSNGKIVNCLVYDNRAYDWGGGMSNCGGDIINCTITANFSGDDYCGGLAWCSGTITNCIIWGNGSNPLYGSVRPTYSCYPGGHESGSINIEPEFVNESKHDYRLRLGSPCVDAGTNEPPGGLAEVDIDGNIRPIDGDYDGVAVADMGAYELTELIGIEIAGPEKVAASSIANYNLVARHEGGSVGGVTGGWVNWWVEPGTYASIYKDDDNGVLQTEEVDVRQDVTVYAEYVKGQVSMEAQKTVSILPVCPAGGALQLDGRDDYVEIVGFKGVTGVRSRTVSAWIKTTMTTVGEIISWGYDGDGDIWGEEDVGGHDWVFRVLAQGNLRLRVGGGGINGTTLVADGQWHHVAAVLESDGTPDVSDIKLYVDGIEDSTPSGTQRISTAGVSNVRIGVFGGVGALGDGHYFEGAIDEVRIWNVARTQQEILANMHRRMEGDEAGLVGYWNLDEGQGEIVYDLSPKGNNGYLHHGPAWIDAEVPIGFCNIEADVHIVPKTISSNNRLKRIMAIMHLPEGIGKGDVVRESFELYAGGLDGEPVGAILERVIVGGNMTRVFVLFDKDEVMNAVEHNGRVELTVVGRLKSGQYIYGRDTVRIVQPRRRRASGLRRR